MRQPVRRATHIKRRLARTEEAAVDLAEGEVVADAAGGDRGHRLVEHAHAFRDTPADDERLAEQRERLDL